MLLFPRDLAAERVLGHTRHSTLTKRLVFLVSLDYVNIPFFYWEGHRSRGLGTLPSHRGTAVKVRTQISVLFLPSKRCLPAHGYPRRERALSGAVHTAEHGTLGTWFPGQYDADGDDKGHCRLRTH